MTWHTGRLCAFDLETTHPDPAEARIVQCAIAHLGGGPAETIEQLVDPGVDIPPEATKVHGITDAHVRDHGVDAGEAAAAIALALGGALANGQPIVGHNISYDLTVLDRECRRHLQEPLESVIGRRVAPVIDTLVLSKRVDPYRKRVSLEQGAHVLKTCVEAFLPAKWSVTWDDQAAHGALYDCRMAALVAVAIAQAHPAIGGADPMDLHTQQAAWRAEQCASFQQWLRSEKAGPKRDPNAVIRGEWPLIPA
ncbi:exonuclease domain-containing protein [Streptomonospora nanhaiensis]|uniref:exonuclease domain-containing protein n=1 Tax=Streptomonospora nanhaiensis TaxID=1323731 RepID=UPI001C37F7C9|nr:exonuclease domain-containing protein [Streptomonospora nanhaiensis]MBV2366956.1 3'-5' exonuclease [Streptomonospora nanhaiensis]